MKSRRCVCRTLVVLGALEMAVGGCIEPTGQTDRTDIASPVSNDQKTPVSDNPGPKQPAPSGGVVMLELEGHQTPAYLQGTAEFEEKSASLRLSPAQAEAIALDIIRKQEAPDVQSAGELCVLVGDTYVFSGGDKSQIDVWGMAVDGNTGEAKTACFGRISFRDHPRWGDIYFDQLNH